MGCHLICNDGLGRCMSIFAYITMLLSNLVYFLAILKPALNTDQQNKTLIEYLGYCIVWLLMFFSHVFTMCADPGSIPLNYEYQEQVLAAPFKTLAAVESAF